MPTIGRDGMAAAASSAPYRTVPRVLLMQKRALTGGKARTNSGRQSICSGAPALRLWRCCSALAAVRQRSASGVAAARSHGRICPDAGRRTVPRGPEGPVHARAPTACAALAWPACRPVSPHGWPMMDGCNTRLPAHGGMPERSSSTKRAVRTSLYMQSVHEQLVQRETGPEWTAAARVPPLQQPAPASGRAC